MLCNVQLDLALPVQSALVVMLQKIFSSMHTELEKVSLICKEVGYSKIIACNDLSLLANKLLNISLVDKDSSMIQY